MAAARKIAERFPNTTSTNNTLASDMLLHSGPCLCCPLVLSLRLAFYGQALSARPRTTPRTAVGIRVHHRKLNASKVSLVARGGGIDLRRLQQCHSCERRSKLDLVMTDRPEDVMQTNGG